MSLKSEVIMDDLKLGELDSGQPTLGTEVVDSGAGAVDKAPVDQTDETDEIPPDAHAVWRRRARLLRRWPRSAVVAYGVLPALALLLALGAGWLGWQNMSARQSRTAATQSVQAALESTIALLSYHPDTAEQELGKARDRLTGHFRDDYEKLTKSVVIPGAKQKSISATARVPAAASVSASEDHAVVLVFVDQTTVISGGAPTDTASSVRITLDKVDDRWLISAFEPV